MSVLEECIQASDKHFLTTAEFYELWNIMRHGQAVFGRQGLVEERIPPWQVPWRHFCVRPVGYLWGEDFRFSPPHRVKPVARCVLGHDESTHALPFIILAPEVLPVM